MDGEQRISERRALELLFMPTSDEDSDGAVYISSEDVS